MWKWKHFIIITVEQRWRYWQHRKQGIRWDFYIWDQNKFLKYNVSHTLASGYVWLLQVWTDWKGRRASALCLSHRVTLTATSSWVALVRTRNSWFRMVGRKAIITWPSMACRLCRRGTPKSELFLSKQTSPKQFPLSDHHVAFHGQALQTRNTKVWVTPLKVNQP